LALYAEVVEIVCPAQAVPGDHVDITVRIKNLYSAAIGILAYGALECGVIPWPVIDFPDNSATVESGETWSFNGSFTMPGNPATIHAYSYWWGDDGNWHYDDELTASINPAAIAEPDVSDFRIQDYIKV